MKTKKQIAAFLSLLLALAMLLAPSASVQATEANEAVREARNGIVQVMWAPQNAADEEYYNYYGGTGFLIGTDDNAQYVITNNHVANPLDYLSVEEQQAVWDDMNTSYDKKLKSTIRIVLKRDSYVEAEVIQNSVEADFAILKLEKPIYGNRTPLVLGDSDQLSETTSVYALGFPALIQYNQDDQLYTSDDVTVTNGTVQKMSDTILNSSPIPCINHSATISEGNSGGPLVTADGVVMGLNTFYSTTGNSTYYYSIQINEIRDVLDLEGIEYKTADSTTTGTEESDNTVDTDTAGEETAAEETTTPEPTPEETGASEEAFDELEGVIADAEAIDTAGYTDESAAILSSAIADAKKVYNNTESTEEEIAAAIDDLESAQNTLVEAQTGIPVWVFGVIAAVVVIIIVIIVVAVNSGKKKKAREEEERRRRMTPPMGGAHTPPMGGGQVPPVNQAPMGGPAPQQGWNAQPRPQQPAGGFASFGSDGSEETGVLNDGGSETTVLGGASIPSACLLRRKNGEKITISKAIFKIGKERRRVDYCVADNTNVSRSHADIVYHDGAFYIVDKNATNGTTVNGVSVAPGQERQIANNDIIRLADEEFQFKMF